MVPIPLPDDEHELHYNPQRALPDFAADRALRAPDNAAARAMLRCERDVSYGDHPLRTLDIYPAAEPRLRAATPVHVFFHGGYWRAQDKENFAFVAAPLVAQGITTVVANYELCPASTLDGVVASAQEAFAFVARTVGGPVSLSGHSAGAHLVASILATDWAARGIDPALVTGAVMVSGIYDPAPAIRTTVNAQLNLTPELASRHDFERRPPLLRCPVWLFAGGQEPWRWIEQTFHYGSHLRRHAQDPAVHILPGLHHFSIMGQFLAANSPIGRALTGAAHV